MPSCNKGQAAIIDLAMLAVIVTCAIAFLQIYTITHANTQTENLKYTITQEYAANTLLSMDYVTAPGIGYDTVQTNAVTHVEDEDLEKLINITNDIKTYARELDGKIAGWTENITESRDEVTGEIDDITDTVRDLKDDYIDASSGLSTRLETASQQCEEFGDDINQFGELIGGVNGMSEFDPPCESLDDFASNINLIEESVTGNIAEMEGLLQETKDYLNNIETDPALEALMKIRCALRKLEIEMDRYVTYAQLGIAPGANLMDLMPARAALDTKTLTSAVTESLYTEDRLARSDYMRMLAATGIRVLASETEAGMDDPKSSLLQGAALTFSRRDYREISSEAVEGMLERTLKAQGYEYCYMAETCCSHITAGDCENKALDSIVARRSAMTHEGEPVDMSLWIWRG